MMLAVLKQNTKYKIPVQLQLSMKVKFKDAGIFHFLFMSNWKVECKLDQQIGTVSAVKRVFYTLL